MSAALESIRTLTPAQVMELAKRGSLRHLEQLWDGMNQENYKIEVLETFLSHLAVPKVNEGTRSRYEVPFLVLAKGLTKAASRYPPHIVVEIGQRIAAASEGILFWMNFFTGGGNDPYGEWDFEDPNGQIGYHAHNVYDYTNILSLILKFEAVTKVMGQLPAMHNLVLRWWTATCNGEILLYPWAGRPREPHDDSYDVLIMIVSFLTKDFARQMAEAIMVPHPRYDTPIVRAFAQRTIQRMHALTRINTLRHLAHLPDMTNEYKNIRRIICSISNLVNANSHLHAALLQENISENCLKVVQLHSERFSARPLTSAGLKDFVELVRTLNLVVVWSCDAPFSLATVIMRRMVENGLLDIVAEYIKLRALTGSIEDVCDTVEEGDKAASNALAYSSDSALCPKVATTFARAIQGFMHKIDRPLPSVRLEKAVENFVVGFLERFPHLRRKYRVRICDNLQHHQYQLSLAKPSKLSQEACSKCHSVVYCSKRCQTEDWKARHRQECHHMHLDYLERKGSKSWYSHSLRTFQLTSIVHTYVTTNKLWNVFKGRGSLILDSRIVVSCDTGAPENPYRFNGLEDYAELARKRIPEHQLNRFDELVKRFKEATPHSKETRNGVSFLSLGLVEWAFRTGNAFLHSVVLLRRSPDAALPGNASDFEVNGYLVYTSRVWEWETTSLDPKSTYAVAIAKLTMDPVTGYETAGDELYDM